ncbi:MAG: RNA polymerase factor sigma-54 [Treponema sp.]|nr:RNA polymerase factor sigma-54 [Treponema sp.]
MDLNISQRAVQKQIQKMSQKQIHSLRILSMSSQDLAAQVEKFAEENPALIIDEKSLYRKSPDGIRIGSSGSGGEEASDAYLSKLESKADNRKSLAEHLLSQLNMTKTTPAEHIIAEKLIYNLDQHGFHVLSPISLLDRKDKAQTPGLLEKCISMIRQFDPPGLCVKDFEESLYVQALQKENPPELALFILDGKMNFLNPPRADRIVQKVKDYLIEQGRMFGHTEKSRRHTAFTLNERTAQQALDFIKKLDPFPARDFSVQDTHFVAPDLYIERLDESSQASAAADATIVKAEEITLAVHTSRSNFPELALSQDFPSDSENLRKAREFIEAIQFRQNTLLRAGIEIARHQAEFFREGPGSLKPLKLQDIADKLGLHETTISRMAASKYIECEWGLFSVKYFFTNSASRTDSSVSRDRVLSEIKNIIEENVEKKKLSDQKISDLLKERGIPVARRTVAKYRSMLNMESSYNR